MIRRHVGYVRAESWAEALHMMATDQQVCRPLAGGTDLLVQAHKGQVTWDLLVDISQIAELRVVAEESGALHVGAAVTHATACEHPLIRNRIPLLASACRSIGSPQIRNRGTIGGNVGNAAACADAVPALVCLDAQARVATPDGEYDVPIADLVCPSGRWRKLPWVLIREFSIPTPLPDTRMAHFKIGRRQAQAIARLSLAFLGRLDDDGRVAEARGVPGACTPSPQRFDRVEAVLLGEKVTESLAQEAGRAGSEQMMAITGRRWSTRYKSEAIGALIERSIRLVFGLPEVM